MIGIEVATDSHQGSRSRQTLQQPKDSSRLVKANRGRNQECRETYGRGRNHSRNRVGPTGCRLNDGERSKSEDVNLIDAASSDVDCYPRVKEISRSFVSG